MKRLHKCLNVFLVLMCCFMLIAFPASISGSGALGTIVTPANQEMTLAPGQSQSFNVTVTLGGQPVSKGDIMLVFDRTGSMGSVIDTAKASGITIMNNIRALLPDSWFGVASFMDYNGYFSYPGYSAQYGSGIDVPWELDLDPQDSISVVSEKINSLTLGSGDDGPESYTRVLYELQFIKWRSNSKKIVIIFGDAPAHDLDFNGQNTGGDPGRDNIAGTADDLDYQTVVQQLNNKGISVIAVNSGGSYGEGNFKGMSIGYADAPGTKGQYYELGSTADIPSAVVSLINAETQTIDKMEIKVVSKTSGWVTIDPPYYESVGANTTSVFTVTVKAPATASPGYYPFILQTVTDGALAGITYLDVTVPSNSTRTSLDFTPEKDGYSFTNTISSQTWEMFEQFFGYTNVKYSNGRPIIAAQDFYSNTYSKIGNPASCDGFASTSLINYYNLDNSSAGSFALGHIDGLASENETDEMQKAIAYSQGIQKGFGLTDPQTMSCNEVGNAPKAFFDKIRSGIDMNSPMVLWILWKPIKLLGFIQIYKAGGHALVPYKYEINGNTGYVYVYDSNHPGETNHRVEFNWSDSDPAKHTWKYELGVNFVFPVVAVGDNSWCNMAVNPIGLYLNYGIPQWKVESSAQTNADTPLESIMQVSSNGPVKLLITDSELRRLGWDGDQLYQEIPDAEYRMTLNGDPVGNGTFYLPSGQDYTIRVQGYQDGEAVVTIVKPGLMATLNQMQVTADTVMNLDLLPSTQQIKLLGIGGVLNLAMKLDFLQTTEDRAVSVQKLAMAPGKEFILTFVAGGTPTDPATVILTSNSTGNETYNLSLQRSGEAGYQVFGTDNVILPMNADSVITVSNWIAMDTLTVGTDLGKDGIIDYVTTISNTSVPATISAEADRTEIQTGGEKAHLVITVYDQYGSLVKDGTDVHLVTTLGSLSAQDLKTQGGMLEVDFYSGSQSGQTTITMTSGLAESTFAINISSYLLYLPYSMR